MNFRSVTARLGLILQTLPLTLPVGMALLGVAAMIFLMANHFYSAPIWIIGLGLAGLASFYVHRQVLPYVAGTNKQAKLIDLFVVLLILGWMVCNMLFAGQHLYTDRDPATYNNAGGWLIKHDSLSIPVPSSFYSLKDVHLLPSSSLGFASSVNNSSVISAQGTHLLPAYLGLAGRLVGLNNMLRVNVILGGLALLSFYGFARLVVKRGWAALATLTCLLMLPMIYFSRDSYTEPLSMMFIFGALSLLYYAIKTNRYLLWGVAALTLAAASMARIDAYLSLLGALVFVMAFLAYEKRFRMLRLKQSALFLVIGFLVGYLGWLDVTRLSSFYYQSQRHDILLQLMAIGLVFVLGVIGVWLAWTTPLLAWLDRATGRWRERAVYVIIPAFFVVLASRPLWFVGHTVTGDRSFSEQTINWIWWYLGPVVLIAGVAGLCLLIVRVIRQKHVAMFLPFVLVFSASGLLYLISPSITGDQPWASRRLLPVVLPGFILMAVFALDGLRLKKSWKWQGFRLQMSMLVAILATLVVVSPLFITAWFLPRRLYAPELAQIQSVCTSVPAQTTVVWLGTDARSFLVQPTRTVCGLDSMGLDVSGPDAEQVLRDLGNKALGQHQNLVVGLFATDQGSFTGINFNQLKPISTINYADITHTYKKPPHSVFFTTRTILLGKLNSNGTLSAL
jgi:hypothetical protein